MGNKTNRELDFNNDKKIIFEGFAKPLILSKDVLSILKKHIEYPHEVTADLIYQYETLKKLQSEKKVLLFFEVRHVLIDLKLFLNQVNFPSKTHFHKICKKTRSLVHKIR